MVVKQTKRYYYFRGIPVFIFDLETKSLDIGEEAFMCCFISEDFKLMAKFLKNCYNFVKTGKDFKDDEFEVY